MYGQVHPLTQKSPAGKIIAGLTLPQVVVLLLGLKLSYEFSLFIPAIPVNNFIFSHIHHMIPLFLAAFFLVTKQPKTGQYLVVYFYHWLLFKMRKKTFTWRRK